MQLDHLSETTLLVLSIFFYVLHGVVIVINVFGWLWRPTRKLNLWMLALTLGSWFILGFWKSFGYCPLTDWHYDVLRALGESGLPRNYIGHLIEKMTRWLPSNTATDIGIGITTTIVVLGSIWVNFFKKE